MCVCVGGGGELQSAVMSLFWVTFQRIKLFRRLFCRLIASWKMGLPQTLILPVLSYWCMAYTKSAPRRQQFIVAPAMSQPNRAVSTPLRRMFKTRYKRLQSVIQNHHSSGAVWESRWTSWAVRPNEPSGFRGRKDLLNRASALVTTCP